MSEQSNQSAPANQEQPRQRRRRGWLFITMIALAAAFTGALTTRAVTQGFGPGWHHRGFMAGPLTPAEAEDRADRFIRHAAIEIDATAEQQEKLRAIAKAAVKDLLPIREKAKAARERATTLLSQPTLDRAAIEAFRAEQVAQMDAISKRVAQVVTDAATILSVEQRRKIEDRLRPHPGFWGGWRRG